ncbi:MAG: hypothetical protein CMK09_05775 [Ponticaulis sp.]|nr:hypothetical protein [Ponticaulis sp.]
MGRNSRVSNLAIIHNYHKEGRRVAVVQEPINFVDANRDNEFNLFLVVTRGYKTDFASLPWVARLFFSPFADYAEAAIIHDWLYAIGEPGKKREADLTFLQVMLQDGVSPITARYFYTAVRFNSLFDNGGFGRESEWKNGFFSTILEDDIPEACLIEKPESAFFRSADFVQPPDDSELTEEDYDAQSAFAAALLQRYDPYVTQWVEAFSRQECKDSVLGSGFTKRTETQFNRMLAQFSDEFRDRNRDYITHYMLFSEFSDDVQKAAMFRPHLEAYMKANYDTEVPEEYWCLSARDQLQALRDFIYESPQEWAHMDCGRISRSAELSEAQVLCTSEQSDEFDFWLGEWIFADPDTKEKFGDVSVRKGRDNCTVIETNVSEASAGTSLNYHDPVDKVWRHYWISSYDKMEMTGNLVEPGHMAMEGTLRYFSEDVDVPVKSDWRQQEDGSVRQTFEIIPPGETEWQIWSDGLYYVESEP